MAACPHLHKNFFYSGMHTPVSIYGGVNANLSMRRGGPHPYHVWHRHLSCKDSPRLSECVNASGSPSACYLSLGLPPLPPHSAKSR